MDIVLETLDYYVLDYTYAKLLPKDVSTNYLSSILNNSTIVQNLLENDQYKLINDFTNQFTNQLTSGDKDVYGNIPQWFDTTIYTSSSILPRSSMIRQSISVFFILWVFGLLLYLGTATFSYIFIFDKKVFNHPRYLKNQVSLEIKQALGAIPIMAALTVPWFLLELKGYSKLYWDINDANGGMKSIWLQYPCFIMFTDFLLYLTHRWLHWPKVYKMLHKPHHKWLVTTPFASHAFHPIDGYFQSLPYHIYPFLFPLHKANYLLLFTFVSIWSVLIHDGEYVSNNPVINGAACHTVHHLYFNYNYGQFTTLWDRIGFSYRKPEFELFDKKTKHSKETWDSQISKMERIKEIVEGDEDDRIYISDVNTKKHK
ncbi:C-5 sterol desaturase [Wickerhamomyces ciferrii]|uniref:C-5 sterol desaturase n=1 Tax=Wickerhamomyces ciferrii (strain ATCC 14091 / BCRC 22168 / CBS 111 / JCM 3599 / NBRC 0793 / NRRL Y-1031 F-60-10) TaxID=1206466 RepID=K0KLV4_WICCF|nr:C-5 sterol desaturase [Wickerhamomyces ciferrii]CCH42108.1 C-5 sterol desaturase [Wickerhamomyces ciferrii]